MNSDGYKETEMGLIPEEWEIKEFEDCIPLVIDHRGKTPTKLGGKWSTSGFRALSAKNIKNGQIIKEKDVKFVNQDLYRKWMKKEILRGDILLTSEAPLGESLYWDSDEKIVLSQRLFGIRANKNNINPKYLFYLFQSSLYQHEIHSRASGTTVQGIRQAELLKTKLIIPPIDEQMKIGDILFAIDKKIFLNNQMNQTLEQISQTIFRHWFVHFEFSNDEGRPYKSSGGEMVDSELGEIPAGWEVGKLGDVCSITMGQSPKSEFYNEEGKGLPFHQGVTNFGKRFPTEKMFCTVENKIAEYGDILFSVRAPVGRINIAKSKIVIGRGLSAIRHKKDFQSFLLYQLKNIFTEEDSIGSGTVFNAITRKDLDDLKVLVPNEELDKQFNDFVSPMEKKIENLILENDNLTKIRDSLLPKLMTGKIRVVR